MIPKGIPEKTLGWGVLDWGSTFLAQPDGKSAGETWKYSNEQARFILWFYAIDDSGEFIYQNGYLSRPKGWGKTPLLAALCCSEMLGPVEFSHWDEDGNPVGRQRAMSTVQLAATAFEQTENTMSLIIEMLGQGIAETYYNLELGLTRVRAPGGSTITRITAASKSKEGQRPHFAVLDETHLWVESVGGPLLFEVVDRNLGKVEGRWVQTTNAPVPGEGSVAEDTDRTWELIKAGEAADNLLYDNREVVIDDIYNKEEAMPLLEYLYGDSAKSAGGWVNLENIWRKIVSPLTKESVARRFYFNQRVRLGSGWLNMKQWEAVKNEEIKLRKSDRIALGFRGQTRNGATALVACRLRDNAIFVLKHWETDDKDTSEIDWASVDEWVRASLEKYNVKLFFIAPQNWQDVAARWAEDWEDECEEFWTSNKARYAKAIEQFETAVSTKRLVHNGEEVLTRHIENAQEEDTPSGKLIRKVTKKSSLYISVAEAAVLAFEAAQEAIERGLDTDGPDGTVWSF